MTFMIIALWFPHKTFYKSNCGTKNEHIQNMIERQSWAFQIKIEKFKRYNWLGNTRNIEYEFRKHIKKLIRKLNWIENKSLKQMKLINYSSRPDK